MDNNFKISYGKNDKISHKIVDSTNKRNDDASSIVTKRYSDNVFCMLYSDKNNLLDLYNALNNSSHTDVDNLTVTTLKGGTYMKYKNDASFVFSYELYMFEQQSTINLNMPLRYLHYGSEIYREIYPNNYLHKRSMLKIPTPHFITFYNGREKMNERVQILRLSDMFEQKTQMPELELVVTVININPEKDEHKIINNMSLTCDCDEYMKKAITNADILNRCKSLNDYMIFVNKVRNKTDNEGKDVRAAVIEAVDECINENVLSEFFIKHRDEVIDVSVFEYDEKGVMDIMREEGKEEGIKEGKTEAKIEIFKGMTKKLDKSAEEVLDMVEMDDEEKKKLLDKLK